MSMNNTVILIGNVGRDPEVRSTNSGMQVASFSLATTKQSKGEKKTIWHNIKCFDKLAGVISKYVGKGSKIGVMGELVYNEWEKDGIKRVSAEIIANQIEFLSSKSDGQGQAQYQGGYAEKPQSERPPAQSMAASEPPMYSDDDIPF